MKHHSKQELDEKIHAFLTSKTEQIQDWQIETTADDIEEKGDRKSNFFSPFIALKPLR